MDIPMELYYKVMLYNSHPIADLFRKGCKLELYTVKLISKDKQIKKNKSFYDIWSINKKKS